MGDSNTVAPDRAFYDVRLWPMGRDILNPPLGPAFMQLYVRHDGAIPCFFCKAKCGPGHRDAVYLLSLHSDDPDTRDILAPLCNVCVAAAGTMPALRSKVFEEINKQLFEEVIVLPDPPTGRQ